MGHLLLNLHSRGAAGRNRPLNARTLLKEKIPVPPLEAQQRIAAMIQQEKDLARTIARDVELVREYQIRLISDVVTGKLDVRGIEVPETSDDELLALAEEAAKTGVLNSDEEEMEVDT